MDEPENWEIRPTTMRGLKRLAKKIKKDIGCAHHTALEDAAKAAGFHSYQAARVKWDD